jgi:MSHA biogenesis protein MshP
MTSGASNPRGIALPAMVFLLVVVALLVAAGMRLLLKGTHAQSLQIQQARALSAAKAATDWGLWQVSDRDGAQALGPSTLPACFATRSLALPAPLADVQVQVSCTRTPATGAMDEGGLKLASYSILASASLGNAGTADRVLRQFEARQVVCRNPGGTAPAYTC